MYLETKEIGPEGLAVDRRLELTPQTGRGEEPIRVGPVHLSGELFRVDGDIAFSGDIETVAALSCSRCVEPFDLPLGLHFNLLYVAAPEETLKGESRVHDDSITISHYDGERIDLDELLAEQIYLGLPLKPLCTPDCKGLCAGCGANLNLEACRCREERSGDPRLLGLKSLL